MKIGVLSDTHLAGLNESFIRRVEELAQGVDHLFHLGDSVSREVLDFLNSWPLTAVSGNMDPPEVRSSVPIKATVELGGLRFGLIHGWGPALGLERRVLAEMGRLDCVCFGHSHRPFNQRVAGVLLFNPGSARNDSRSESLYGELTVGSEGVSGRHLPF